jgi:hypothetical protein
MKNETAVQKVDPKEIQQRTPDLQPMSGEQMANAIKHYKEIQVAIDTAMPEGLDNIQGKKYRNKVYWRAAARAFRINVEVVNDKREQNNGGDFTWHITCRASFPNGDCAVGTGSCSASEKKNNQRTEHNVRAHAETRAYNRAVSNLVGFGEVTSEEIDRNDTRTNGNHTNGNHQQRRPQGKPPWHAALWDYAKKYGMNDTEWSAMRQDAGIHDYNKATKDQQQKMSEMVNSWIADQEKIDTPTSSKVELEPESKTDNKQVHVLDETEGQEDDDQYGGEEYK